MRLALCLLLLVGPAGCELGTIDESGAGANRSKKDDKMSDGKPGRKARKGRRNNRKVRRKKGSRNRKGRF